MATGPYIPMVLTLAQARALRFLLDRTVTNATPDQRRDYFGDANARHIQEVRRKLESELKPHDRSES